jgi:hypothetical protein
MSGWVPPDRFASDPLPDGQSNYFASVGFEYLPRASGRAGQSRRVGKVNERRLGEQRGTGGVLPQLLPAIVQAVEPGGGGVFFSVRPW